jgi:hypothetical protein
MQYPGTWKEPGEDTREFREEGGNTDGGMRGRTGEKDRRPPPCFFSFRITTLIRREAMEQKPGFIRNNEEWIVWLLAEEFGGLVTPPALSARIGLPLDFLHDNLLYLERTGMIGLDRDAGKKYPDEIAVIRLAPEGQTLFEELKQRPGIGDDLFG